MCLYGVFVQSVESSFAPLPRYYAHLDLSGKFKYMGKISVVSVLRLRPRIIYPSEHDPLLTQIHSSFTAVLVSHAVTLPAIWPITSTGKLNLPNGRRDDAECNPFVSFWYMDVFVPATTCGHTYGSSYSNFCVTCKRCHNATLVKGKNELSRPRRKRRTTTDRGLSQ